MKLIHLIPSLPFSHIFPSQFPKSKIPFQLILKLRAFLLPCQGIEVEETGEKDANPNPESRWYSGDTERKMVINKS